MIFYTSDLHFGGRRVISVCHRPFQSPEDMTEGLISRWNDRVREDDDVFIVGDLFTENVEPDAILSRLRGHKYLILGNNEDCWLHKADLRRHFGCILPSADITDGGRSVSLCHIPPPAFGGEYLVYGHIHNYPGLPIRRVMAELGNAFNAGVDVNDYEPVTLDEMILRKPV